MKSDLIFELENASWSALLVDSQGIIKRASSSAITIFGKGLESGSIHLSTIWSNENKITVGHFLSQLDRALQPLQKITFIMAGGVNINFSVHICSVVRGSSKHYILQLFSESPQSRTQKGKTDAHLQEETGVLFPKQKLECALQLARTVALDFNNALTSIIAHTSFLLSKIEPNSPWRKSLMEIEKSAQRAAEVAADLASFSRQAEKANIEKAVNLNDIIRRAVRLFKKPGEEYPKIILNLEKKIYAINFDEAKIQQAIVKVLENAVHALPDGGRGNIYVTTRNLDLKTEAHDRNVRLLPGHYLSIEITDDGCGIPLENIDRVFEPFFTTKPGCRGLGLTWVYGIITNNGGNVSISSEPGRGTTVIIYLPANNKIVKDISTSSDDLYGNSTILMVDDEDLILTMGQTVLSEYGYKVLIANNGYLALDILKSKSGKIDLVITDLVMPQMSGRELVEHTIKIAPEVKILYTSGFLRPNNKGIENYLQKPFTSQDLLLKVKQVLSPASTD